MVPDLHGLVLQGLVWVGRRLVDLLQEAQRTNAFTNASSAGPWVVGREVESHVHHENAF